MARGTRVVAEMRVGVCTVADEWSGSAELLTTFVLLCSMMRSRLLGCCRVLLLHVGMITGDEVEMGTRVGAWIRSRR